MVKVWVADISPLLEQEFYEDCKRRLPLWRRDKADRLKGGRAKAQSVGAWMLWMQVQREERLSQDAVFNLSHSGNYVMCAVSDKKDVQVGCDLEVYGEYRDKVARRFFCEEEYRYIIGREGKEERRIWFYRYWVLKESFLKATRRGMGLDTRSFCVGRDRDGLPFLMRQPAQYPQTYYYQEYREESIPAGMAVCTTDPEIDGRLYQVKIRAQGEEATVDADIARC